MSSWILLTSTPQGNGYLYGNSRYNLAWRYFFGMLVENASFPELSCVRKGFLVPYYVFFVIRRLKICGIFSSLVPWALNVGKPKASGLSSLLAYWRPIPLRTYALQCWTLFRLLNGIVLRSPFGASGEDGMRNSRRVPMFHPRRLSLEAIPSFKTGLLQKACPPLEDTVKQEVIRIVVGVLLSKTRSSATLM